MATVAPGYGAWLKTDARRAGATVAGAQAAWGDLAQDSDVVSPLAFQADAQAEAVDQAEFLAGPLVVDTVVVLGQRRDLIARAVPILGDRYGYKVAPVVFVIGADEGDSTTTLTVLKRL